MRFGHFAATVKWGRVERRPPDFMHPPSRDNSKRAPPKAPEPTADPRAAKAKMDSDISALLEDWESPTVPPPFDLESFAREHSGGDMARQVPSDRPTEPAPEDPSESNTRLRKHRPASPPSAGGGADVHPSDTQELRARLADRFFEGEYEQALALAEQLVTLRPDDVSAKDFADECRRMLEKEQGKLIGSLDRVPKLAMSMHQVQSLALDHRAGFLLSRVDGDSSLDALLDVVGMPRVEALRIVAELVDAGVLRLEDPR
jgi:hypothetical protein